MPFTLTGLQVAEQAKQEVLDATRRWLATVTSGKWVRVCFSK
jgi:hypothetical protein